MRNKFWQIFLAIIVMSGMGLLWSRLQAPSEKDETTKVISPWRGEIKVTITATGTVLPKNRLQVKPPVNGRMESVLVQEGQAVKTGDVLAWMSSTDRAALLDAARGQGLESLKEWQDVYKPIPLMSPIDGEVIVGTIQPGQTVTTVDDVVVLSDRLIIRAQVDETDIGKIQNGQSAEVTLDAYPEAKIKATVDHIYYESQTVNNVTIYDVDLLSESVPAFFRSGMSANIDFMTEQKTDILLLPLSAIKRDKNKATAMVHLSGSEKPVEKEVMLGLSDDKNVEIVSGLTEADEVILTTKKYSLPKASGGTNPFVPQRRR